MLFPLCSWGLLPSCHGSFPASSCVHSVHETYLSGFHRLPSVFKATQISSGLCLSVPGRHRLHWGSCPPHRRLVYRPHPVSFGLCRLSGLSRMPRQHLTSFNDLSRLHHLVAAVIGAEPPLSRTFIRTVSKW